MYVAEEDTHLSDLTVKETLDYAHQFQGTGVMEGEAALSVDGWVCGCLLTSAVRSTKVSLGIERCCVVGGGWW